MPRTLSKTKIILGLICPRRLFLEVHHPKLAQVPDGAEARFEAGHQVGDVARAQFPEGVLIEHGDDPGQALRDTLAALKRDGDLTLFEPAFQVGGAFFRADILRRKGEDWWLVEVKSSASVKDYHLWDVATQLWVLDWLGIRPDTVQVAHIDKTFVYPGGGDYRGLFAYQDVREAVAPLKEQVAGWVEHLQAVLEGSEPGASVGAQCSEPFECPFYDHCDPPELRPEYPVTLLPYGGMTVQRLKDEGYRDLRDVPADLLDKPNHRLVHHTTLSGEPFLDAGAAKALNRLPWPRYYLDFETIQFAVPIWPGTRPYQQLPFQWSCHVEHADESVVLHMEFLDISGKPPMRAFAESLLASIPDDGGAILGYNVGFERSVMNNLAEMYPDISGQLRRLAVRCADLLTIARRYYYHRDMKGSWSIKAVLPTVAPDLDYANLDVQHGTMAQEAYLEAIHPDTPPARKAELSQGLLAYCERDTRALVRLAAFFSGNDLGIGTR